MVGPLYASGQILCAHAFALVVLTSLLARSPLHEFASPELLNDLGNLLLTFVVIWAYMVYFQFMLIWITNIRYEVIYYLPRMRGGWQWVTWALVILHFAVPFFLLLMRDVKRNPALLAGLSGLVLIMHLMYLDYEVLPAFADSSLSWLDVLMPVGIGGVWLADYLWELERRPLLALHDRSRETAIALRKSEAEVSHA